jgi:hypothetical protein
MSTTPEPIEVEANPYARRVLLIALIAISAVGLIYLVPLFSPLRLPAVLVLAVPLIMLLMPSVALLRLGDSPAPLIPTALGLLVVAGGPVFDMLITVIKTPDLAMEANPVARVMLDAGLHPMLVLWYGLILQALLIISVVILWIAFLRHRETLIETAWAANPKTFLQFLKAATGSGDKTWRQWWLPTKMSDLPRAYHLLWALIGMWLGYGLARWYLGLEWLGVNLGPRLSIVTLLILAATAGYFTWLWLRYRAGPPQSP